MIHIEEGNQYTSNQISPYLNFSAHRLRLEALVLSCHTAALKRRMEDIKLKTVLLYGGLKLHVLQLCFFLLVFLRYAPWQQVEL